MMHLELRQKDGGLLSVPVQNNFFEIGVAAKNCNSVNYSNSKAKIRRYEKNLIHFQTGIAQDKIFFLDQEHGDQIIVADSPYPVQRIDYAKGDALVTNVPGFCLVIRTADCYPVFIVDETINAIAAIHSGWKSTEKKISSKAVNLLNDKYGSSPENMKAYILPGIGGEYYEVSGEVAKKFEGHYKVNKGKYFLSLKSAIYYTLIDAGLGAKNIFASFEDTYGFNDKYFSHRRGEAGRNLNYIYMV